MIKFIITIIGFAIALFAFMSLLEIIPAIGKNKVIAGIIFIIIFGAGITVAYIAWWLAVIVGIIALVLYVIKKRKPLEIKNNDIEDSTSGKGTEDNSSNSEDNK